MLERRNMTARVWVTPDVRDTLLSLIIATDAMRSVNNDTARTYLAGWDACLASVAAAFGLEYTPPPYPAEVMSSEKG